MNYYEELGVPQDASLEDIRQAYKMMARLLHPDRQLDPALKQVAERQMTRLGEIVGLLTNPRQRSHYDDVLLLGNRLQATARNRTMLATATAGEWEGVVGIAEFALRYWFWILMGAFVVTLGAWSFVHRSSTVPDYELPTKASQYDVAPMRQAASSPPRRRLSSTAAKASPLQTATRTPLTEESWEPKLPLPEPHQPAFEDIRPIVLALPEPSPETVPSAPRALPPAPGQPSFIGRWLYSPKPGDVAERGVYPAMYVELQVVGNDGEMAGNYHARYKVLDQALSPDVVFQIHGAADSATSARFGWISRENATGQAEMTLRGPNVLYISWWTTAFSRQATLGSGTATLIRQQVP